MHLFKDKFGRNIRLTEERLQHISEHSEFLNPLDKIEETLIFPSAVIKSEDDPYVWLYYKPYKFGIEKSFLLIIVKISNGEGFVITSFYTNKITGSKWKL